MTTPPAPAVEPMPLDPAGAPGPGPFASAVTMLSDRAGDVLGVSDHAAASFPDRIAHAISTLDAVSGHAATYDRPITGRRREIVDAASELFAIRGFRGTSLRDISGRVGISHPGMLHYFKSKDALLDAVIDDLEGHAQHVIDHIESIESSLERAEQAVARDFSRDGDRMLLFAILSMEAIDPEYPGRMRLIRLRRVYEHIAERVLRTFQERGDIAADLDVAWAARTVISFVGSVASRDATIGAVQPSSAGLAGADYAALVKLIYR